METGKPLISIVMAVYEPNMQWLKEQLLSLEAQTYPNLELIIRDDCSPTVPFEQIKQCVSECIRSYPYEISRNERNLGSNLTFEWLTRQARGEYIAYCDQDDVWLPEKISILQKEIEQTGTLLVCSDMYVIDGQGNQTADSITKVRRHHVFHSGDDLAEELLFHNFVTGCTMMICAEVAKKSIPFCPYMVHDHYLALCATMQGRVQSIAQPLIQYRIHGGNQTGLLTGVKDKQSYCDIRITGALNRLSWLENNLSMPENLRKTVSQGIVWLTARQAYWQGQRSQLRTIWKYRKFSLPPSLAEIALGVLPESFFMFCVRLAQKNRV